MATLLHVPKLIDKLRSLESLPLLLLRLYLAPIFISSGLNKINGFEHQLSWFAETLNLPFPKIMLVLAIFAEFIGGFALLFGLGTRIMAIPLMITMLVATFLVHWNSGWFAIAPGEPSISMATIFEKIGFPGASESLANSAAVHEKLEMANTILAEHGNIDWLTESGNFVVLNNGIEFAATYFIMLLVLFVYGPGRISIDRMIYNLLAKK